MCASVPQGAAKKLEHYRNVFVNLALSYLMFAEPQPCDTNTLPLPDGSPFPLADKDEDGDLVWRWSMWDTIDVKWNEAIPVRTRSDSDSDSDSDDDSGEPFAGLPFKAADGSITLAGFLKYLKVWGNWMWFACYDVSLSSLAWMAGHV